MAESDVQLSSSTSSDFREECEIYAAIKLQKKQEDAAAAQQPSHEANILVAT